ncbi:hypothetical protein HMPREF0201_02322 [Cedecea davisae DSM 4568]|uniref:Uncharacterized protein n=1 Tax=Cedecea davisae DSM 4568 TaxID=566551 RepID=S3IVG5_9ENTR|nr:hypothetical protein HMPREF0201_02322 [Cedecea davisae DSM 4568]
MVNILIQRQFKPKYVIILARLWPDVKAATALSLACPESVIVTRR